MQLWTQEFKPVFAKESLRSMVEEASNLVREGFEDKNPQLRVKTTIKIDPEIRLDAPRARLIQAFLNIIHNSYEAIKKQGIINISATTQNDAIIIRFEDNGSGMSAETRAVAMSPFTSTKNSTGFGLAITYKIVHEECRGDVEILPVDKGCIIEVTLPRQQQPS
jgi:signal transduction histidine kinase